MKLLNAFKYKAAKIHIIKVIWHTEVAPQKRQFLKAFKEVTLKLHLKNLEITLRINVLNFKGHTVYPLTLKVTKYLLLSAKLSSAFIKNENWCFCYTA